MKNILICLGVASLLLPAFTFAAIPSNSQLTSTQQLIVLLLEKVKELQSQLDLLLKEKAISTVPVAIVSQNQDYQKEVGPLVDSLEEKNLKRKALVVKLDEAKCLKPYRTISKGVTTFVCRDKERATTTIAVYDKVIDAYVEYPVLPQNAELSDKVKSIAKEIAVLDKEIEGVEEKIKMVKLRYGL